MNIGDVRPATAPVTLRQVLRLDELSGALVVGAEGAMDAAVRDVVVVGSATNLGIVAGALVVAGHQRQSGFEAELLIRQAYAAGAVGVVLPNAPRLMLTTRRLADGLRLPLIALSDHKAVELAWRLATYVHEPERYAAQLVSRMLHRLRSPLPSPGQVVDAVAVELGGTAAVLRAEGARIAGSLDVTLPPSMLERAIPQAVDTEAGHLLCAPVFVDDPLVPDLWLVVELPPSHPLWVDAALQVLTAAALALATWVARQQLLGERDARDRSTLLSDLIEQAPALSSHVAEGAVRAGWRLEGWHVGVQIRLPRDASATPRITPHLREALDEHGLGGPVVERADGWACWVTTPREPPSSSFRDFAERVRQALDSADDLEGAVAGVGRPYAGSAGLVRSLQEAREASLFAGAGRRPRRVEHIDELGVNRLLAGWYRSEAFRTYARQLLAPLLDAREEYLLETLRVYLELESSASSAAAALGIHRNTVSLRIEKVESMLSMNLARPDERLVLQLACRVVQVGDEES